jgi:hypothetical protein
MKMRVLMFGSIFMLMMICVCFSADINGKWKGTMEAGPQGAIEQIFTFKVDGGKITGTMSDPMMGEAKITEGTLKGDDISFTVTGSGQMGEMKLSFKGKLSGADEMKLSLSFAGGGPGGGGPDGGGPGGPGGGPGGGMEIIAKRMK